MELTETQKQQVINKFIEDPLAIMRVQQVCKLLGLVSPAEMARRCGLLGMTLRYAVERGDIPTPAVDLGQRRYYRTEQVDQIRAALRTGACKRTLTAEQEEEARRLYATGDWTQWDLADQFAVTQSTISRTVLNKRFCRKDR